MSFLHRKPIGDRSFRRLDWINFCSKWVVTRFANALHVNVRFWRNNHKSYYKHQLQSSAQRWTEPSEVGLKTYGLNILTEYLCVLCTTICWGKEVSFQFEKSRFPFACQHEQRVNPPLWLFLLFPEISKNNLVHGFMATSRRNWTVSNPPKSSSPWDTKVSHRRDIQSYNHWPDITHDRCGFFRSKNGLVNQYSTGSHWKSGREPHWRRSRQCQHYSSQWTSVM